MKTILLSLASAISICSASLLFDDDFDFINTRVRRDGEEEPVDGDYVSYDEAVSDDNNDEEADASDDPNWSWFAKGNKKNDIAAVYPKYGHKMEFEYTTAKGKEPIVLTAEYVKKREDNTYDPPQGCMPIPLKLSDKMTWKDARQIGWKIRRMFVNAPSEDGLQLANLVGVNWNNYYYDNDGGLCDGDVTDPVLAFGNSAFNKKGKYSTRLCDNWVKKNIFNWNPIGPKYRKSPATCQKLTQAEGFLVWNCKTVNEELIGNTRHFVEAYLDMQNDQKINMKGAEFYVDLMARVGCYCGILSTWPMPIKGNHLNYKYDIYCAQHHTCMACALKKSPECESVELAESPYVVFNLGNDLSCKKDQDENGCMEARCQCDKMLANALYRNFIWSKGRFIKKNLDINDNQMTHRCIPESDEAYEDMRSMDYDYSVETLVAQSQLGCCGTNPTTWQLYDEFNSICTVNPLGDPQITDAMDKL